MRAFIINTLILLTFFLSFEAVAATDHGKSRGNLSIKPSIDTKSQAPVIQPLNAIVATVNNEIITRSELNGEMNLIRHQLAEQGRKVPPYPVLKKQVLNQLIDKSLQLQQAKAENIHISNQQLNAVIANIAAHNGISEAMLKEQVIKQGLTYREYRHQLRQQLMVNAVQRQALAGKIQVPKEEVNRVIAHLAKRVQKIPEYHLRAILVPVQGSVPSPTEVDSARAKAESIVNQLKAGANFSDVAIAESAGNQALQGGDMGWKQLTQLPPPIAAEVSTATKGTIIGPVQSPNGFYVLKVVAIRNISARHWVVLTHVRHILLKQGQLTPGNTLKAKLLEIRREIIKGASFASMAEKYSQDPNTSSKGGDLGWIANGEVPPAFARAMQGLAKGQISEPIATKDGWELIQVLGHKRVDDTEKNLKQRVTEMIYARKFQQAVQSWVHQLRGDAYIQVNA